MLTVITQRTAMDLRKSSGVLLIAMLVLAVVTLLYIGLSSIDMKMLERPISSATVKDVLYIAIIHSVIARTSKG